MSQRLDDIKVRNLPAPATGNKVYYDRPNKRGNDWTPGFGVRVTAAGARSFVINYRTKDGTERRHTIGSYPSWSLAAARIEARKLKRAIDQGSDPVTEGREQRNAETVSDLCTRFLEEHVVKKRPATARDYTSILKVIESELGNRKVASVEYRDIDSLHRRISASAPYRANRAVTVASKMFSLAVRWKIRADNPCKGIEYNPENHRERYLSADELGRLTAALDTYPDQHVADAFRLLLLTGPRSGEVFSSRWEQFDLELGKWTKRSSHTKQKKDHNVPLSPPAQKLLRRIRARQDGAEGYLFPSNSSDSGHFTTLKKPWREICEAAGISNLRVHDLRHSYASFAVNAGWSLPVIGALLGHTKPETTHRYAHLVDDVLARATNTVGAVISGKKKALSGATAGKAMKPVESGDMLTVALEFIKQRREAGRSIEQAYCDLATSEIIPFSHRARVSLICGMMALSQRGPHALRRMLTGFEAEQRQKWFDELKEQGIVGQKAEEIVAAREFVSVETMRKRRTRANKALRERHQRAERMVAKRVKCTK